MTTPSQQIIEAIAEKCRKAIRNQGGDPTKPLAATWEGFSYSFTDESIKSAITEANAELIERVEELEKIASIHSHC